MKKFCRKVVLTLCFLLVFLGIGMFALVKMATHGNFSQTKTEEYIKKYGPERFRQDVLKIQIDDSSSLSAKWPDSVKALKPIGIYIASEGIYIKMEEMFVTEKGVFVPFKTHEQMSEDGDSSFEMKFNGIYFYYVTG